MHQQQLAMLAQQQSLLMAAAAKSTSGDLELAKILQQNGSKSMPAMNWSNSYQMPGLTQLGAQQILQNHLQVEVGKSVCCFSGCSSVYLMIAPSMSVTGYEHISIVSTGKLCAILIRQVGCWVLILQVRMWFADWKKYWLSNHD